MRRIYISVIVALMLSFVSCSDDDNMKLWIDSVREIGDSLPEKALSMLNSRKDEIGGLSEDIRMKYDLTKIRLEDKSYIPAKSDSIVKVLLDYYEKSGSVADKQETYFYAGSVYRDLGDTPRSMEHFLKSMDIGENNKGADSVVLRNTYSSLNCSFFSVQDYQNAYKYAKKEYDISQKLRKIEINSIMHLGASLMALKRPREANKMFKVALDYITDNPRLQNNTESISLLLTDFVLLEDRQNAERCKAMLDKAVKEDGKYDYNINYAYGDYNNYYGSKDSAIAAYSRILENGNDLFEMYDAAKALLYLYYNAGNMRLANEYAVRYIRISDSIDLGKRQELAATVNNAYKYYKNKNEEERVIKENEMFQLMAVSSFVALVVISLLSVTIVVVRRNRHLKEKLRISEELNRMQILITEKEGEISDVNGRLKESRNSLNSLNKQLEDAKEELNKSDNELKEKEMLLTEMNAKNLSLLNMLHKEELEVQAEDVINAIKHACAGSKDCEPVDWQKLYKAVDELYPALKEKVFLSHGNLDEKQVNVCYLMQIGLSGPEIAKLTGIPRTTVWRWMNKFDSGLSLSVKKHKL